MIFGQVNCIDAFGFCWHILAICLGVYWSHIFVAAVPLVTQ